jgi:hypothetical protein
MVWGSWLEWIGSEYDEVTENFEHGNEFRIPYSLLSKGYLGQFPRV